MMESKRIHDLLETNPNLFGEPLNESSIYLLDWLQQTHDNFNVPCEGSTNKKSMRDRFEAIAGARNLAIPRKAAP